MVQIILTFSVFFIFSIIFLILGYAANNNINKPNEKKLKLEKIEEINNQLLRKMQMTEDANRNNYQWYINQLYNLGNYLKMQHNDDHILIQLNNLTGQQKQGQAPTQGPKQGPNQKPVNIVLAIDPILDRILDVGFDNLTKAEKEFLYKQNEKDK